MTLDQLLKPLKQQPQPSSQHLTTPAARNLTTKPTVTQTKKTPPQTTPKETCHTQNCYHLPKGYTIGQCTPTSLYIPTDLAKKQKLCTNQNSPYNNHHQKQTTNNNHSNNTRAVTAAKE